MEHPPSPYFQKVYAHKTGGGTQRSALGEDTLPGGGNWDTDVGAEAGERGDGGGGTPGSHSHSNHAAFEPNEMKAAMPKGMDGRPMKETLGRRSTDLATGGWEESHSSRRDLIGHGHTTERRQSVTAVELFGGVGRTAAAAAATTPSKRRGSVTAVELFGALGGGGGSSPATSPPADPHAAAAAAASTAHEEAMAKAATRRRGSQGSLGSTATTAGSERLPTWGVPGSTLTTHHERPDPQQAQQLPQLPQDRRGDSAAAAPQRDHREEPDGAALTLPPPATAATNALASSWSHTNWASTGNEGDGSSSSAVGAAVGGAQARTAQTNGQQHPTLSTSPAGITLIYEPQAGAEGPAAAATSDASARDSVGAAAGAGGEDDRRPQPQPQPQGRSQRGEEFAGTPSRQSWGGPGASTADGAQEGPPLQSPRSRWTAAQRRTLASSPDFRLG